MSHPAVRKAADWLESVQQADGGWGETCASYDDRALMGQGTTTASQTAWAVLGLVAAGRADGAAVRRGVDYLLRTQRPDGGWDEPTFTGTGFPKVFYLKYHLYRVYFPLMALARYQAAVSAPVETPRPALACRIPAEPRPFDV
jgi:squalene-hopene/tetraprenyl-beta-curcumene cyclase